MMRRRTVRGGFTLVEVLVAVSLLGVTMATGAALFSSGLRLREVSARHLGFARDARGFTDFLRDDLAHLVPAGPPPMITADAIVLWRLEPGGATHRLVTYQWSGGAGQDSVLVRVTVPVEAPAADLESVEDELRHWARVFDAAAEAAPPLVRQDAGPRFGDKAVLDGRTGAWTAWPAIGSAAWGLADDPDPEHGGDTRAHLVVRVSAAPPSPEARIPDPDLRLALMPRDGATVDAGFWLPIGAVVPTNNPAEPAEGADEEDAS
jgi:prepilin-type N-terminal cleavage/methylation domain-containing protein